MYPKEHHVIQKRLSIHPKIAFIIFNLVIKCPIVGQANIYLFMLSSPFVANVIIRSLIHIFAFPRVIGFVIEAIDVN
jgi:hypothetical protein